MKRIQVVSKQALLWKYGTIFKCVNETKEVWYMNIAICDDDYGFVDNLENIVRNIMANLEVTVCIKLFYSGKELLQDSKQNSYDIILIDIDMPQKTGFSTVEEIYQNHQDVNIIFITAHEEFAYQAYDYHPYQFVHKNDLEKLPRVLASLHKRIVARSQYYDVVHLDLAEIVDINVNNVVYIKSEKNYVVVHDLNSEERKYRGKIKNVYMQLKEHNFIYPQRSYVVNCRYISDFDRKEITLKNGDVISVSRDNEVRHEAQCLYGKYIRSIKW